MIGDKHQPQLSLGLRYQLGGLVLLLLLAGSKEPAIVPMAVISVFVVACRSLPGRYRLIFGLTSAFLCMRIAMSVLSDDYSTNAITAAERAASLPVARVAGDLIVARSLRGWFVVVLATLTVLGLICLGVQVLRKPRSLQAATLLSVWICMFASRVVGPDSLRHLEPLIWVHSIVICISIRSLSVLLGDRARTIFIESIFILACLLLQISSSPSFIWQFASQESVRRMEAKLMNDLRGYLANGAAPPLIIFGANENVGWDNLHLSEQPLMLKYYFSEYLPKYEGVAPMHLRDVSSVVERGAREPFRVVSMIPEGEFESLYTSFRVVEGLVVYVAEAGRMPERVFESLRTWTMRLRLTNGHESYWVDAGSPLSISPGYSWYLFSVESK